MSPRRETVRFECRPAKLTADRQQRVKEARSQAAEEIDAFKSKKEQELSEFSKEHIGSTDDDQKKLDEQIAKQEDELKKVFESKREAIMAALVDRIVTVDAKSHRNFPHKSS